MKIKILVKLLLSVFIIVILSVLSFSKEGDGYFKNTQNEKFVYKFEKGKEYKYSVVDDIKQSMTQMGQEMIINIKGTILYTFKVIDILNDGSFLLNIAIDSLKMDVDNPMAARNLEEIDKLNGKTYKAIMTKLGEIRESELLEKDSLSDAGKQVAAQYDPKRRQFLIQFQENLSGIGDTCLFEPKVDTSNIMGLKTTYSYQISLKVVGKEVINGYDVFKLSGTTRTKISGSGEMQQAGNVTITGEGKAIGEYFFAQKEGLLIGYKMEQNIDMNVEITSMGMTMPMNTVTITTVKLVK